MPFWAEKVGVPRTLAIEHPFGHILGQPHQIEQQTRVIHQALDVLQSAEAPGNIAHSPKVWPVPQDEAMKNWQPAEPSPVISHMSKHFRAMLRKNRQKKS